MTTHPTLTQFAAMVVITQTGPLSGAHVAEGMTNAGFKMTIWSVFSVIYSLVRHGLVQRIGSGKGARFEATEAGWKWVEQRVTSIDRLIALQTDHAPLQRRTRPGRRSA